MAVSPSQRPDDNAAAPGAMAAGSDDTRPWSGTPNHDGDPTNMAGQYPPGNWGSALFGGPQPDGTGAPGTQGARYTPETDPTNEPGQLTEGLSGIGPPETDESGAPGMSTTPNTEGGSTAISYTEPGGYLSGTWQQETVRDDLAGSRDSTQANDEGYNSGGPQLPGIAGNEPGAGAGRWQPGRGRVLRGGRDVRP